MGAEAGVPSRPDPFTRLCGTPCLVSRTRYPSFWPPLALPEPLWPSLPLLLLLFPHLPSVGAPWGPATVIAVSLIPNESNNTISRFLRPGEGWESLLRVIGSLVYFIPTLFSGSSQSCNAICAVLWLALQDSEIVCVVTEGAIGTRWTYPFFVDSLAGYL